MHRTTVMRDGQNIPISQALNFLSVVVNKYFL